LALTDEEFAAKYFAESTLIGKLKLAIKEDRYTIWERNPPNFSSAYLTPILSLPSSTPVEQKDRESGGRGVNKVLILKYRAMIMGKSLEIYLKGYFGYDEGHETIVVFEIQSLKEV